MSFRTRLARLLLVVALLAGWQAALVHPLQHVDADGHLIHTGAPASDPSATLCDVLGALTGFVASPLDVVAAAHPDTAVFPWNGTEPRTADPVPFSSQGPPTLL